MMNRHTIHLLLTVVALSIGLALPGPSFAANGLLTWSANGDPDLAGYVVHYGTASRNYSTADDVGNTTSYVLPAQPAGTVYYFSVTAYDAAGNESAYSNEVIVSTIPVIDHTAPSVVSVRTLNPTTLEVVFSEAVDPVSAQNPGHYLIDNGATAVSVALLGGDGRTVRLTMQAQVEGQSHVLAVQGVSDQSATPNAANAQVSYTVAYGIVITPIAPAGYDVLPVYAGDPFYVDQATVVSSVPAEYQRLSWVRTANADKADATTNRVQFTIDRDAIVYVGYDGTASAAPAWLASAFVPTGDGPVPAGGQRFKMWARNFAKNSTVVLGGNLAPGASGATHNYIILVKPLPDTPTVLDVDMDGMTDSWEVTTGLDPSIPDASGDPDADGLTNLQEFWLQRNPRVAETFTPLSGNQPPTLPSGMSVTGLVQHQIVLDANAASDPEGGLLAFGWSQVAGPPVVLIGASASQLKFTPALTGLYAFRLMAQDVNGAIAGRTVYAEIVDTVLASAADAVSAQLSVTSGIAAGSLLRLPDGVLSSPHAIAIARSDLPRALPSAYQLISDVLTFTPSDAALAGDVTVGVGYPPQGASVSPVLLRFDSEHNQWTVVSGSSDLGSAMEASVNTLGTFVVAKPSGAILGSSGTAAGGGGGGGCSVVRGGPSTAGDMISFLIPLVAIPLLLGRRRRRK